MNRPIRFATVSWANHAAICVALSEAPAAR